MAKPLSFFFILLIVNSLFFIESAEARPFNIMKSRNSAASRAVESFFDGLSLGEIKQSGPSPGGGNSFTSSQTLGGIKDGPSPCCGNTYGSRLIPSVCHVEEKSKILLVEDGTLATFPGTFEEHEEEIRSDIKAEVVPMKLLVLFLSRFISFRCNNIERYLEFSGWTVEY
ncbi:hypothetical protein OIU84_026700 [Salix udensis]|uniref:Uncharacterized protein n=1 Tax=Salix udensis TaxID=889485 RepID=A0AAD6KMC4_9ROSI|nr:hypothetical protein OIU84_026700 [Salix udensis]